MLASLRTKAASLLGLSKPSPSLPAQRTAGERTEGEFREVLKTMSQPGIKALSIRDFFPNGEVEFKALSSYESILRYCTTKVWAS